MTLLQIEFQTALAICLRSRSSWSASLRSVRPCCGRLTRPVRRQGGRLSTEVRWSDGRSERQRLAIGADDLVVPIDPPDTEPPDILSLGDPLSIGDTSPRLVDSVDQALLRLSADPNELTFAAACRASRSHSTASRPFAQWRISSRVTTCLGLRCGASATAPGKIWGLTRRRVTSRAASSSRFLLNSGLHVFEMSGRGQNQYVSIPAEHAIVALRWVRIGERRELRVDAQHDGPCDRVTAGIHRAWKC